MSNVYINHQQEVDKRQTEKCKHSSAVNIVHVTLTRTARVEHSGFVLPRMAHLYVLLMGLSLENDNVLPVYYFLRRGVIVLSFR